MKNIFLAAFLVLLTLAALAACTAPLALLLDSMGDFHATADLADLDGDGDLDALVHNVRNEAEFTAFAVTTLWLNDGAGYFTAHRMDSLPDGPGWAARAGDVDQDGAVDLVTFTSRMLRLALNQGGAQAGTVPDFTAGPVISAPRQDDQFGTLLLGDLDGDSRLDGVVLGCCGRTFTVDPDDDTPNYSWVWLNTSGSHGAVTTGADLPALEGLTLRGGALADLDGDGDLDLYAAVGALPVGRNHSQGDRVLLNDGAGAFVDSGQRLGDAESTAVALGDVDGDGDADALVGADDKAILWVNQGGDQEGAAGSFVRSPTQIPGDGIRTLFLADMVGDGTLDAVVGSATSAAIWYNDGSGAFTVSAPPFAYSVRHALAVGDLDGDGAPDLFAAAYDDDARVRIVRSTLDSAP
ncbi:MAG: VCBS repeat-containing protein [Caldilinea sp.]|nr:VCBS repeat-containing protein [Caldilinea sp.]